MSAQAFRELIGECDQLIRRSQFQIAKEKLSIIDLNSIPRRLAQEFAHLHFRCGLFFRALKILNPIVYPKTHLQVPAEPLELATYAICLIRIGSVDEALRILQGLNKTIPQAELYQGYAYQTQWDYAGAIPQLRNYLLRADTADYERAVARVNLAACLIMIKSLGEAEEILTAALAESQSKDWPLLAKNIFELQGQLAVSQDDLSAARHKLGMAEKVANREDSLWDFFVAKWKAIVEVRTDPASADAVANFRSLRARAEALQHWESVRECDRYLATATRDTTLLKKLYFGTPYPAYRATLERETKPWAEIPNTFVYGASDGPVLNLNTGGGQEQNFGLKPGQALHLGLLALASDRYKPMFSGLVFSRVFSGEYFNPETGPDRVSGVVKRLRSWFAKEGLDLKIEVNEHFYRLLGNGGLLYTKSRLDTGDSVGFEANLIRLKEVMREGNFTSMAAAGELQMSKVTVLKVLNYGVSAGQLEKSGNNRSVRYKFTA